MTDTLIILAGGASSRMKKSIDPNLSPEMSAQANLRSKGLIEVAGRPFLSYLLDNVLKAGFKDVLIITGENSELFRSTYEKNKDFLKESQELYNNLHIEKPNSNEKTKEGFELYKKRFFKTQY